jgi:DNA-directed RNA polymerase subunit omega
MRVEELTAKALQKANIDRYTLALAVAKRTDELLNGAASKLSVDTKNVKPSDLALMEIAEGLVGVEGFAKKEH